MSTRRKRKIIIQDFSDYISRHKTKFYKRLGVDIVMDNRNGIYFHDLSGKRYINCHCNGGVFNLGHKNPDIVQAVLQNIEKYDIGNHHLISHPRSQLAKKLVASLNRDVSRKEQISKVIFAVSGGESVDFAIKLARGYTGKQNVLSLSGGYHGHTGLALATGDSKYREPFGIRLPGFLQTKFGDWAGLELALKDNAAALILETCPATLGMPIFPNDVMHHLRELCTDNNVLMIMDEIQTGLGRTGKIWGFQHYKIMPDIVVTGKGLSGGIYPIAATCFKQKYEKLFKKDPFIHISTYGGSEIGCFAALKTLEIASDVSFLNNVNELSSFFKQQFTELIESHDEIIEFRQLGLFMGVVFRDSPTCLTFIKTLMNNGIYAVYANNDRRVMQFLPPLITTRKEAEEIMTIIRKTLVDLKKLKNRLIKTAISVFMS